jgi:hypothetical protein
MSGEQSILGWIFSSEPRAIKRCRCIETARARTRQKEDFQSLLNVRRSCRLGRRDGKAIELRRLIVAADNDERHDHLIRLGRWSFGGGVTMISVTTVTSAVKKRPNAVAEPTNLERQGTGFAGPTTSVGRQVCRRSHQAAD